MYSLASLKSRLFILDFVLQLWRKESFKATAYFTMYACVNTVKWETFEGEKFRGFVAIWKCSLCKIWVCGILWWHQREIHESFLHENLSFLVQKFPAV